VLVTDLGLLAKQSTDGSRDVFVQSIVSGEPVAGVTVDVVAKNGSTLFSQTTDAAGACTSTSSTAWCANARPCCCWHARPAT
jgi:uncharacterized protein YfaS (alpha-2-macroglobulin family)